MKRFLILLLFFTSSAFAQEKNLSGNNNLFSPVNLKKFGDYLFCQRDYLRAIEQYRHYLSQVSNDTVEFKIALAYSEMGDYYNASKNFEAIKYNSPFYTDAKLEVMKSLFKAGDFLVFRNSFNKDFTTDSTGFNRAYSLYNFSFLLTDDSLPPETKFLDAFPKDDSVKVKQFYEWNKNPPKKSPAAAAILSAIIPGAGKFYTHKYEDGIWAFIASVGFAYLSYDNFHARHNLRGWLFGGLAAGFYAGNIYGSAASAQIYNAKIHFDFVNDLKAFLDSRNYFLPKLNFCK